MPQNINEILSSDSELISSAKEESGAENSSFYLLNFLCRPNLTSQLTKLNRVFLWKAENQWDYEVKQRPDCTIDVCPPIKYPAGQGRVGIILSPVQVGFSDWRGVRPMTHLHTELGREQEEEEEEERIVTPQQQKHYLIIQKSACWIRYRESVRFWWPQWPRWPPAPPLPLGLALALCHTWCQSRINHWNGARQELTDRQQQLFISDKDWLIV